ncbi:MAG TPA: DUF4193 family protein [Micromonosporaceae bacterium]|nr:DUF4193 family protein [Micromonosporaceae bacterium]
MTEGRDYDATRRPPVDLDADSLDELAARGPAPSATADVDETGDFELPMADLSDEELVATVVPILADEFRCPKCFLVHHRSRRTKGRDGVDICRDCA